MGFLYAETFKRRVEQLSEMERAIMLLQNDITYIYTPLPEAFMKIVYKVDDPINIIFKDASELLTGNEVNSVQDAFIKSLEKNKDRLYLKKEDVDVFIDLTKDLGKSDVAGQNNIFALTLTNIKKQLKSAESIKNKNLKMYRYLGFTLGAMLVIMII